MDQFIQTVKGQKILFGPEPPALGGDFRVPRRRLKTKNVAMMMTSIP
jgi:hypothetical protein